MNPLPLNPNGRLSRGCMSSETTCRKRRVAPKLGWTLYRNHSKSQPPNATKRCELMFAPQQSVGDWSWSVLLIFLAPHACAIIRSRSHPMRRRDVSLYVCSAAVSRRLVLKRPADFPSSACFGQWGIEISRVWLLNCLQLCANLTRLVNFADQKKTYGCSEAGHGDVSTQLIQIDLLVSLSWLVYSLCLLRSWCWPMALGQPICLGSNKSLQSDGRIIYTYELKHTLSDSCIYAANISPYHHMTIHTHNHALTYTHIYVHRHAQHEHSTSTSSQHHIPKHHLTHHNFTSHATRSVYLCLHTFTLLPPNLTSHENNITSHTHTHRYNIRMYITHITNCLLHPVHISLTHYHTKVTHLYMHIHTCTQTHPPSPHHSHTSSSLVAFLCSV